MKGWYKEKKSQIDPGGLVAFGIEIRSRHGRAGEIVEMIKFTEKLSEKNAQVFVKSVFYDSNCALCNFTFYKDLYQMDVHISDFIFACAKATISQFEWEGFVAHGAEI